MRIDELTRPPTRQSAGLMLRKAGYQPLGKGAFATVWFKPDNPFALKLFTPRDRGYLAFLQLVNSFPNKHFPVIRGKPIQVTDDYVAVRIEKLPPPPPSMWKLIRQCGNYLGALKLYNDGYDVDDSRKTINEFRRMAQPELAQAIDLLYQHVTKGNKNMMNDIDIRNCRMRGNDLVFIDPIGWGGGPALMGG